MALAENKTKLHPKYKAGAAAGRLAAKQGWLKDITFDTRFLTGYDDARYRQGYWEAAYETLGFK